MPRYRIITNQDLNDTDLANIKDLPSPGAVSSVNGQTGVVVLSIPDELADLTADATHRTVTDTEKSTWNGKADALTSDQNYVSDAQLTVIGNTSGTNTGDQNGGTPAIVLGTANTAGSSPNFLRRDDTILAFDVTSPSTQAYGDSAVVGVATVASRRDHKHAMPASTKDTTAITGILKGNGTSVSAATGADLPTMTATIGGAVPTPPNNTTTFLRGDGTFATPDIKYVTRVISSAEILDLYNTPIEIIPAPGANKMIRIVGGNIYNKFNTTAYASGGTTQFYYNTTSTPAASTSGSTSFLYATSSAIAGVISNTTLYVANVLNLSIIVKMLTQNPTTGDGTFIISLAYIIIDI